MKQAASDYAMIVTRKPITKVAFVRRALAERGSFLGLNGDKFHATAIAMAATDAALELVDEAQQVGKSTAVDGWRLRRRPA